MKINLVDSSFSKFDKNGHIQEFSNNPRKEVKEDFGDPSRHGIEWVFADSKDKLVVYTDDNIKRRISSKSIAWLIEPREIRSSGYRYVEKNYKDFKKIWTYDKDLINTIPNAVFYPFGGCWIEHDQRKIHSKRKLFSIISSNKHKTDGHKLRHQIIKAEFNNIDIYGRGYTPINNEIFKTVNYLKVPYGPIDNKIEGLKDYFYHFVVENVKRDYWFTEKLIDSFITGTIPIYWGCPSIGDFFNTKGMIIFNDLSELKEKLKQCTSEFYQKNISVIKENFELAKNYTLAEDWIYKMIKRDNFLERPRMRGTRLEELF